MLGAVPPGNTVAQICFSESQAYDRRSRCHGGAADLPGKGWWAWCGGVNLFSCLSDTGLRPGHDGTHLSTLVTVVLILPGSGLWHVLAESSVEALTRLNWTCWSSTSLPGGSRERQTARLLQFGGRINLPEVALLGFMLSNLKSHSQVLAENLFLDAFILASLCSLLWRILKELKVITKRLSYHHWPYSII